RQKGSGVVSAIVSIRHSLHLSLLRSDLAAGATFKAGNPVAGAGVTAGRAKAARKDVARKSSRRRSAPEEVGSRSAPAFIFRSRRRRLALFGNFSRSKWAQEFFGTA